MDGRIRRRKSLLRGLLSTSIILKKKVKWNGNQKQQKNKWGSWLVEWESGSKRAGDMEGASGWWVEKLKRMGNTESDIQCNCIGSSSCVDTKRTHNLKGQGRIEKCR